jgi:hypothetical protein
VRWAAPAGVHIDRAACAWLIRRHVDPQPEFGFVTDPAEVLADATPFDMRGVELSHHGGDCTFETILRRYHLADPVLWKLAEIVHEADIDDSRYGALEAPRPGRGVARAVPGDHRRPPGPGADRTTVRRPVRVPPPGAAARPPTRLTRKSLR